MMSFYTFPISLTFPSYRMGEWNMESYIISDDFFFDYVLTCIMLEILTQTDE